MTPTVENQLKEIGEGKWEKGWGEVNHPSLLVADNTRE